MSCQMTFQLHFYNEHNASAVLQTQRSKFMQGYCELVLFSCITLRQLHNLRGNRVSVALAEILSTMYSSFGGAGAVFLNLMTNNNDQDLARYYIPFIAALGYDISELVGLMPTLAMYRAATNIDNEQLAREICPNIAQVREYSGVSGRKKFIASLSLSGDKKLKFNLKPVGFGLLGRGINYYAPMSVILTFKYLQSLWDGDEEQSSKFRSNLILVADKCANTFLQGNVSSYSQSSLPIEIVNEVAIV